MLHLQKTKSDISEAAKVEPIVEQPKPTEPIVEQPKPVDTKVEQPKPVDTKVEQPKLTEPVQTPADKRKAEQAKLEGTSLIYSPLTHKCSEQKRLENERKAEELRLKKVADDEAKKTTIEKQRVDADNKKKAELEADNTKKAELDKKAKLDADKQRRRLELEQKQKAELAKKALDDKVKVDKSKQPPPKVDESKQKDQQPQKVDESKPEVEPVVEQSQIESDKPSRADCPTTPSQLTLKLINPNQASKFRLQLINERPSKLNSKVHHSTNSQ